MFGWGVSGVRSASGREGVLSVEAAVLISVLFWWEVKAPGASAGGKVFSVWRVAGVNGVRRGSGREIKAASPQLYIRPPLDRGDMGVLGYLFFWKILKLI